MATARPAGVALKKVGDFDSPVYVTGAPGYPRLLFVVEQAGRIVVLRTAASSAGPSSTLRYQIASDGERGLLSVAFPPDYKQSGRFYVYYTDQAGNIRIDEFQRAPAPTRAEPGSRRTVISIPHPVNANHNGGQMQFLGDDLYFGTGDGGSGGDPPNNAQNQDVLLGKLLRIDPRPPAASRTRCPPRTRSSAGPAATRSTATACATPSASPSTRSRRAAADRDRRRRPEPLRGGRLHHRRRRRAAPTSAGTRSRASHPNEENSGTPDPGGTVKPIFAYPHDRGGSCSMIGGYVVGDRSLPALSAATSTPTSARASSAASSRTSTRASGDRKLGLARRQPLLVRRRPRRPRLRRLARRPGLPAGAEAR